MKYFTVILSLVLFGCFDGMTAEERARYEVDLEREKAEYREELLEKERAERREAKLAEEIKQAQIEREEAERLKEREKELNEQGVQEWIEAYHNTMDFPLRNWNLLKEKKGYSDEQIYLWLDSLARSECRLKGDDLEYYNFALDAHLEFYLEHCEW